VVKRELLGRYRWRRHAVAVVRVSVVVIAAVAAVTTACSAQQSHSSTPQQSTIPFIGILPHGVAVDSKGTVYVTDDRSQHVVSLASLGSTAPTVWRSAATEPFT
jgi:streptogramin lyase